MREFAKIAVLKLFVQKSTIFVWTENHALSGKIPGDAHGAHIS